MRSITVKLIIAFLLIGLLSVSLFAGLLGLQTRLAFDRFIADREREFVVDGVRAFAAQGVTNDAGNAGADHLLTNGPIPEAFAGQTILTDPTGIILLGPPEYRPGTQLDAALLAEADTVVADGETVGYIAFLPNTDDRRPEFRNPLETAFRQRVYRATLGAGIFALLAGTLLSGIFATTLSKPITELTDATRAMAAGDLHQQVPVRTKDELGTLALSFNQMSADLARSTAARRQMTADLAHDLRTPLTVLRGYSEGLLEGRLRSSPQVYSVMYEEVVHLQRLVEDLRTLSLADAGELTLNKRLVSPAALLERAGLAHMQSALDSGLVLRVEADEELPDLYADTDRLAQVLNNLVANALRFTHEGEVVLAARALTATGAPAPSPAEATTVQLEVRDSGEGIADEDLPFVFDRFYRADKSRTRDAAASSDRADVESSGLGLAIARAIVEAHGGQIAAGPNPTGGTIFTITLPAAAPIEVGDA